MVAKRLGIIEGIGPTPASPKLPIHASWTRNLYGVRYGDDDFVCSGGQCVPLNQLIEQVFGKSIEEIHEERRKNREK